MALNTDLVGTTYSVPEFTYTHGDAILYALSVGADESDLEFLYEGGKGLKVYPSYATVASGNGGGDIIGDLGINPIMIIHGEQRVRIHGALPAGATVTTEGMVQGIYDKGANGLVDLSFKSSVDGKLLFENTVSMIIRGDGGFGQNYGPERAKSPKAPERAPDHQLPIQTEARQALMYRLNGDWNPLHADPEIAQSVGFEKPILHGLCSFGCTVRAIVKELCGNDPTMVKTIATRFSSPVIPGDKLTVNVWKEDKTLIAATTNEAGDVVLTNFVIELN